MKVREAPAQLLIAALAKELKKEIEKPDWVDYVKSGAHKERPPEQEDFWWIRAAAILRKLYIEGPMGVNKFRRIFGGRKNRGVKPEKKVKAGGKIIRTILQQLEEKGYVQKHPKGRELTPKGYSFLDRVAKEL